MPVIRTITLLAGSLAAALLASCSSPRQTLVVSVPEQRLLLLDEDKQPVVIYPISTSKFGLGNTRGSYQTPLGKFEVASKIGNGIPPGGVLKSRRFTGEVLHPNAPGRDPIISRILWLRGLQSKNANTHSRYIYIHGTPEERTIGTPASYGCVRMRSDDVIELYNLVHRGAKVEIITKKLPKVARQLPPPALPAPPTPPKLLAGDLSASP
ncbi:MAG: L,D-transpeptidase [Verrucomicrobiales bacterium]|nr:L,D-transpeptidase [Verrucomicrobiales bacterium]